MKRSEIRGTQSWIPLRSIQATSSHQETSVDPDEVKRNPGYHLSMVNYRRSRIPGGTYFFTVTLLNRNSNVLIKHANVLRDAIARTKQQRPFQLKAIVALPDHLHAIWTLPEGDDDYPGRWKAIKSTFCRSLIKAGVQLGQNEKGEYDLWQRRYWEHTISDELDLQRHVDYIHYNPVKHGYVSCPGDWRYSTFHKYVARGLLPPNWTGGSNIPEPDNFGE